MRLTMWGIAAVVFCFAFALLAWSVVDQASGDGGWGYNLGALAVLLGFAAFLIAVERYSRVRIGRDGVDWRVPFVGRGELAWDEVERFEVQVFWTRSRVVAVLRNNSGVVVLNPLDVAWVDQYLRRGWRTFQAHAVDLLNQRLSERTSPGA